jgi:uncharacterized protein (TIGR03067 family)
MPDDFQALPPADKRPPEILSSSDRYEQVDLRKPENKGAVRLSIIAFGGIFAIIAVVLAMVASRWQAAISGPGGSQNTGPKRAVPPLQAAPAQENVAADAKDDATKKDGELLQGTWIAVGAEFGGKKLDDAQVAFFEWRYIVEGDTIWTTSRGKDKDKGASFKLDPSKTPKEIDLFDEKERDKDGER